VTLGVPTVNWDAIPGAPTAWNVVALTWLRDRRGPRPRQWLLSPSMVIDQRLRSCGCSACRGAKRAPQWPRSAGPLGAIVDNSAEDIDGFRRGHIASVPLYTD
jgi:hypothetical protein